MSKKRPFGTPESEDLVGGYDNTSAGSFVLEPTLFDSVGVRETVESVAMAFLLAMVFKVMQAEAYIIPTGSMAPTLMGQHVEVACEDCDYLFQAGASNEGPSGQNPNDPRYFVDQVRCPMTFEIRELARQRIPLPRDANGMAVQPEPNDESFAGDRIVVSKLEYLFHDPDRWDVIVFKYPGAAKVNYIKRLVGLPGETLVINNGDIFVQPTSGLDTGLDRAATIARKEPQKLARIAIPVQDTAYFSPQMRQAGLPPGWVPDGTLPDTSGEHPWSKWRQPSSLWEVKAEGAEPARYKLTAASAGQYDWLRFRHFVPRQRDWELVKAGQPLPQDLVDHPGHLVTDYYCYNDTKFVSATRWDWDRTRFGANWVGDLIMTADVKIGSATGRVAMDAVEGGVHFVCEIDVATGQGQLSAVCAEDGVQIRFAADGDSEDFSANELTFDTPLRGNGSYQLRYANCDNRIYLWIDDQAVRLPGDGCYLREGPLHPYYDPADYGDARPLGIAGQGVDLEVERLQVARDLFYLNYLPPQGQISETSLRTANGIAPRRDRLTSLFENPETWSQPENQAWYETYSSNAPLDWERGFRLDADQFFPMGDNSPQSLDARLWSAPKYVERRLLIGKALMVYWPHTWNSPPFWPNFNRMRMIH